MMARYNNYSYFGSSNSKILEPFEIRFMQDSIHECFRDGRSVNATIPDIELGYTRVNDIPTIEVFEMNEKFYSLDNRRLYVFRVLQYRDRLKSIPVRMLYGGLNEHESSKFTTVNDGRSVRVRRDRTHPHEIPRDYLSPSQKPKVPLQEIQPPVQSYRILPQTKSVHNQISQDEILPKENLIKRMESTSSTRQFEALSDTQAPIYDTPKFDSKKQIKSTSNPPEEQNLNFVRNPSPVSSLYSSASHHSFKNNQQFNSTNHSFRSSTKENNSTWTNSEASLTSVNERYQGIHNQSYIPEQDPVNVVTEQPEDEPNCLIHNQSYIPEVNTTPTIIQVEQQDPVNVVTEQPEDEPNCLIQLYHWCCM